ASSAVATVHFTTWCGDWPDWASCARWERSGGGIGVLASTGEALSVDFNAYQRSVTSTDGHIKASGYTKPYSHSSAYPDSSTHSCTSTDSHTGPKRPYAW